MDNITLIRGAAAVCFIVILFVLIQRRRKRVR
jgi:preprotein translocase subunit SecG